MRSGMRKVGRKKEKEGDRQREKAGSCVLVCSVPEGLTHGIHGSDDEGGRESLDSQLRPYLEGEETD